MSLFENVLLVWKAMRTSRQQTSGRQCRLAPIVPLEVRMLLVGEFTRPDALEFPGVSQSSAAWGDVDNDGDLDVLITGKTGPYSAIAKVYRNNGNGTYTDLNAGLSGVYSGSASWGDADNDGDLDLLLTGHVSYAKKIAKVYRNHGNGTFTDINAGLPGVDKSSAAWGDADNDGDLDVLIAGDDDLSRRIAKVYRNNGNSTFTDLNAGLEGVMLGSVAWGDADNDGDLDILLTGELESSITTRIARVYRNNGNSTFTDLNVGLTGVNHSSVAWGDADNDGDLDILLTGQDSTTTRITKLYRNNTNNTFTDLPNTGLIGVTGGSVAWGDADNDGDLDILLSGQDSPTTRTSKVYRNNGNSTLTDFSAGLSGVAGGSVGWGDADHDGDLDIILTGSGIARLYRNNTPMANTPPASPTGLTAEAASATSLKLTWTAPSDAQTPALGLSYNLRVGTTPGGSNVFSTMASMPNGVRRLPDAGPIQGTSFTLKNLTIGQTYFWSVQAIDTVLAGGAFAAEQSAAPTTNTPPTIGGAVANQPVNDNATIAPFASLTVTDPDNQNMFARVTILQGAVRGDFTSASTLGWTRTVTGNDIKYERFYNPQANIGGIVQAAIRAFVFQPRPNAIKPNTTELTDFTVFVNDGLATATNSGTRVITTSVNNAPTIGSALANQAMNDNQTKAVFSTLTVTDPDTQDQFVRITITNGTTRGDFTAASTTGWTRKTSAGNILYERFFAAAANNGAVVQAAVRALVFQPRNNVPIGTTETTSFAVFVNDGIANMTNSQTSVTTTGVAPRPEIPTPAVALAIPQIDTATVVLPSIMKSRTNPYARLLKKPQ